MKRILFHLLKAFSYFIRPLRHGFYIQVLEYAYKIQGVTFLGKAKYIHHDVYIDNVGHIEIGKNIVISTKAILLAHDYSPKVKEFYTGVNQGKYIHSLKIGDNVFIGAGAIILPNTTIGNYCIIGAGAVVKGYIPDYSVVVGNPCKIIKSIK
ncbi:MAG: hypothetical protein BHV77_08815 [Bacteroides sp. 43_108]|nr:MAG: hypothetical protein BHV77_08815 [Bacteroides sp. 43_108]